MFKQIAASLLSPSPSGTLRTDTYSAIDAAKNWLQSDQPGDGISVNAILKLVAQHTTLPNSTGSYNSPAATTTVATVPEKGATTSTETPKAPTATSSSVPFMHVTLPGEEIPVAIGGVTNLVLALGRADGMAGVMAARAWTDALAAANTKQRSDQWRRGVLKGVMNMVDISLLTTEFGPRLQTISILKSVAATLFGRGSDQARQSEAFWSAKLV
ncbi:hypothetical protein EXIGLDRAFT_769612 [Exidia glandulosa HHB12029]|uniref:Uncharacterized protein n=1 Tax=Exidia glandulosa HHB12029 TaxID=1314781 RepID=A0A165HCF7_EXIGL|nr:hypothetical protein EXIGLDRAFT_769612 [Exidia glandulosa HHB12029]